ncbi:MAG: hypothetical protein GXY06_03895 [Clostridiaceae bacterium]|nr:hypothetical protein [Clostridiaceae bacterium]
MCSDHLSSDKDYYSSARASAIRFIGISVKSSGRVSAHLLSKGYDETLVKRVVDVLIQDQYIDDYRVGRSIISKRRGRHAEGTLKLRQRMLAMGVSSGVVSSLLSDYVDDDVLLRELLEERYNCSFSDQHENSIPREEYRRMYQFLIGRGFKSDMIARYLIN